MAGIAGLTLAAAACRQAAPAAAPAAAPTVAIPAKAKPVIKLAENSWAGSSANVYVAKLLLESKLGYKVDIVTIDENAHWPAIAKGELSAALEVWPSGHAKDAKQYIDDLKQVENIGALGAIGKIGWYVPTYVVEQHPELATWEGFQKPELSSLFKTTETGNKGAFYQGDPSWVYSEKAIFSNLKIDMQIVQAGSENALFAQVDSAYSRKEPIVFYYWQPNWPFAKYKFTKVKLPNYTDACYADPNKVACDYPDDPLYKIAWSGLKDAAPDAYALLKNMSYTNDDQVSIIGDIVINKMKPADAAKAWIDKNEAKWAMWLPK